MADGIVTPDRPEKPYTQGFPSPIDDRVGVIKSDIREKDLGGPRTSRLPKRQHSFDGSGDRQGGPRTGEGRALSIRPADNMLSYRTPESAGIRGRFHHAASAAILAAGVWVGKLEVKPGTGLPTIPRFPSLRQNTPPDQASSLSPRNLLCLNPVLDPHAVMMCVCCAVAGSRSDEPSACLHQLDEKPSIECGKKTNSWGAPSEASR
ncbi:hypothetical protein OKW28_004470 [Paraburkholderia sp. 40]